MHFFRRYKEDFFKEQFVVLCLSMNFAPEKHRQCNSLLG